MRTTEGPCPSFNGDWVLSLHQSTQDWLIEGHNTDSRLLQMLHWHFRAHEHKRRGAYIISDITVWYVIIYQHIQLVLQLL